MCVNVVQYGNESDRRYAVQFRGETIVYSLLCELEDYLEETAFSSREKCERVASKLDARARLFFTVER